MLTEKTSEEGGSAGWKLKEGRMEVEGEGVYIWRGVGVVLVFCVDHRWGKYLCR